MIEFAEMAELMDDDVVCEFQWNDCDSIIEIEIPSSGAAPPS